MTGEQRNADDCFSTCANSIRPWRFREELLPVLLQIDIIEGVHLSESNSVTLHTNHNCSMKDVPEDSFEVSLSLLLPLPRRSSARPKEVYPRLLA